MTLSAAEMQVLASLDKAEVDNTARDRASLERDGKWFWVFLEDEPSAYDSLAARGLIEGDEQSLRLTQSGRPLARAYNRERPDLYGCFYEKLYPAAYASATHSRFCEMVFGQDLCQDGQVDMAALQDLLKLLDPGPADHLLDLGCGAGAIAKYIAGQTGAKVTGLDVAGPAIAEAKARTAADSPRLIYLQGDINALDFPAETFDAVISLDTLYWATDLTGTLSRLSRMVKPGGQLAIFMEQDRGEDDPPETLEAANTDLARALDHLKLPFDTYDYSAQNAAFWRRIRAAVQLLREDFEAEGNGFIATTLTRQVEEFLPKIETGDVTRYFYHVRL